MKPARSPALLALTASALAALGGRAQAQDDGLTVDYRYSAYREADVPGDRLAGGAGADGQRYRIDTHQFRLAVPIDTLALQSDLTFEAMSGASPVYTIPDPADGRPVQVMSGASIEDQRTDLAIGVSRTQDRTSGGITVGHSTEDDYEATHIALQADLGLDDTVTTLTFGAGYSDDTMTPTQGAWPTGVRSADRSTLTALAGYARVLDAVTVVQTTLSYTLHDGYLADPYKQAYIADTFSLVPDARPDQRAQVSWLTRLRRFFKDAAGALHFDYRYYRDDWDVDAHTVDLAWHQRVGATFRLVPGVRYYSQSEAFFYEPYYGSARADGYASSDYRLSPYGALAASLTATVEVGGWGASLRYEHYDSDGDHALGKVNVESPGLVDFDIASLSVKKLF